MNLRILTAGLILAAAAQTASAHGIDGKWTASVENQGFAFEMVFNFLVEGDELTGTLANEFMGEIPIADGKVDGDEFSFNLNIDGGPGGVMEIAMAGVLEDDELTMTSKLPEGAAQGGGPAEQTLTAKRAE